MASSKISEMLETVPSFNSREERIEVCMEKFEKFKRRGDRCPTTVLARNINSSGIDRATFCFTWIRTKNRIGTQPASVVTPLLLVATLPVLQIAKFLCVPVGHSGYSPKYLKRVYDRKSQRLSQCTDLAIKLSQKTGIAVLSSETAILSEISR